MSQIISADEIKKLLPNYSPDRAEEFHRESARMAYKKFSDAVRTTKYKKVILLSGGTASGKSEFLSTHLMKSQSVILDATLSTSEGADIKLKQILKVDKTPIVYSVIPDDLKRAFVAFLNRDRKFNYTHFYKTHAGSRKTLLWIAENYPKVKINLIESSYTSDEKLQFSEIKFASKHRLFNHLRSIQMNESDIITGVSTIEN